MSCLTMVKVTALLVIVLFVYFFENRNWLLRITFIPPEKKNRPLQPILAFKLVPITPLRIPAIDCKTSKYMTKVLLYNFSEIAIPTVNVYTPC